MADIATAKGNWNAKTVMRIQKGYWIILLSEAKCILLALNKIYEFILISATGIDKLL